MMNSKGFFLCTGGNNMTIKEIAEVAGVSYPTVHRAVSKIYQGGLNDKHTKYFF